MGREAAPPRGRHRAWLALAPAVALAGGCYVYTPLNPTQPEPGARLALDLNDEGRVAMATSVGPEVARVEGALVGSSGTEYVIQVSDVLGLGGTRTRWSGETVSVRQEHVKRIRERRFSGTRTAVVVGGAVAALVGVVLGVDLLGAGGGDSNSRGGGGGGDNQ